jgi:imidazole glycerol-phosphate synthase subunit HisH
MLVIIDYNAGNVGSIQNMLKKVGFESIISNDPATIENAHKLILPGVGHFDYCMGQLNASGLIPLLTRKVFEDKTPLLGICVGCQMLSEGSEEGDLAGLGWIKGKTVKFKLTDNPDYTLPHIGWEDVLPKRNSPLLQELYEEPRFYFAHTYHLAPKNTEDIVLSCHYGYDFTAAVERDNIRGVQFHPEKSHKFGMQILGNFMKYC